MKSVSLSESKFNKYGYGLFFGIILAAKMLLNMPFEYTGMSDSWSYLFYITEYKTVGFLPRALIGTICGFFTDYITWKTIYIISVIVTVLLIVSAAVLYNKILTSLSEGKIAIFLFTCTFLLMSDDLFYHFDTSHIGSIDTYNLLLTFAILACTGHKKIRWLVPVLCTICMMNYEGYVFAFMPMVGIVLLYFCFKEKSKTNVAVFVLTCIVIIITFLYFYAFFRKGALNMVLCETPEEMKAVLSTHSDAEINWMIEQLYFIRASTTFFTAGKWDIAGTIKNSNYVRLECLPSALVLYAGTLSIWIKAIKKESDKNMKFIYFLCAFAPVATIPFQVFSEQMKYISYFAMSQFMLLLFFAVRESNILDRLKEIESKFEKNPVAGLIPMCLLMFFRALW